MADPNADLRSTPFWDENADAWSPGGGGEGGGSMTPLTPQTVTTDPGEGGAFPIFDAGGLAMVFVKATLLSFVGDGETFGTDPGDVAGDLTNYFAGHDSGSVNVVPAFFLQDRTGWDSNTTMSVADQFIGVTIPTERYVQVWLQILNASDLQVYSGPNSPTATFLVEAWATALQT